MPSRRKDETLESYRERNQRYYRNRVKKARAENYTSYYAKRKKLAADKATTVLEEWNDLIEGLPTMKDLEPLTPYQEEYLSELVGRGLAPEDEQALREAGDQFWNMYRDLYQKLFEAGKVKRVRGRPRRDYRSYLKTTTVKKRK